MRGEESAGGVRGREWKTREERRRRQEEERRAQVPREQRSEQRRKQRREQRGERTSEWSGGGATNVGERGQRPKVFRATEVGPFEPESPSRVVSTGTAERHHKLPFQDGETPVRDHCGVAGE